MAQEPFIQMQTVQFGVLELRKVLESGSKKEASFSFFLKQDSAHTGFIVPGSYSQYVQGLE